MSAPEMPVRVDEFGDDGGREVLGGDVLEHAAESADRGAQGFADDDVRHG